MRAGYRQVEHPADLAFELWAPSEEELLITGARALTVELTAGAEITGDSRRRIELATIDAGDRLVQWLNEVIVLALVEGFIFVDAEITLTPAGLSATLRGAREASARIAQELKSATYHDLRIAEDEDGIWRARVIIDV